MSRDSGYVAGRSFAARTASKLHRAAQNTFYLEEFSREKGLLQSLDPRAKILGLGLLLLAAASSRQPLALLSLLSSGALLAIASHIPLRVLASRAWIGVLLLAGLLAGPALFTTPGEAWITILPRLTITHQGATAAFLLLLRMETAVTFSALLVLSTPWSQVLKGLRVLRVPVVVVVLLSLTCRYILLLLQIAQEMFEARESRRIGVLSRRQQRELAISGIGVLLAKTAFLSDEVYLAMRSRGYRGEVFLLHTFRMRMRDWMAVTASSVFVGFLLWFH